MRFPAKITSSRIWVTIPVDWVILHYIIYIACGADGRSLRRVVGVRSYDYQIFPDGMVLRLRASRARTLLLGETKWQTEQKLLSGNDLTSAWGIQKLSFIILNSFIL